MSELPAACDVGFKEWAGVCDALASGRQIVILRKGGIAEEGGVFTPEHRTFWLYPTHLHESQQGLQIESPPAHADPSVVPIRSLAVVESIRLVDREEDLEALEPFHVWTDETVRKRFHYRRPGLWALAVRIWSRDHATEIVATPQQLGCKSWVPFEEPLPTAGLVPALDSEAWREAAARLEAAVGSHLPGGRVE